jgi:hypothetical protein
VARRHIALIALLLIACKGGSAKLEGKWKGQRSEGVSDGARPAADAYARDMTIEAKGSEITVTTGKDKQTSKYKVVKEEKNRLVITTEKDGTTEETFTFLDDKTMRWSVSDGKSIFFAKQPAP